MKSVAAIAFAVPVAEISFRAIQHNALVSSENGRTSRCTGTAVGWFLKWRLDRRRPVIGVVRLKE